MPVMACHEQTTEWLKGGVNGKIEKAGRADNIQRIRDPERSAEGRPAEQLPLCEVRIVKATDPLGVKSLDPARDVRQSETAVLLGLNHCPSSQ